MSWNAIVENVVTAVAGALLLSVIYWLYGILTKRKPIAWFKLAIGSTRLDPSDYRTQVAYCVVVLRNRSRSVVKNVEVFFGGADDNIRLTEVPAGTKAEIVSVGDFKAVKIAAVQPREDLEIQVQQPGIGFISPKKVIVTDEDMGTQTFFKLVRFDRISVPYEVFIIAVILFLYLFLNLVSNLGTGPYSSADGSKQTETSESEGK